VSGDPTDLSAKQLTKLQSLVTKIRDGRPDAFYAERINATPIGFPESVEEFQTTIGFTTKADLLADHESHPPFGSNLTQPLSAYTRFCQTSGTSSGQPMVVLDTPESWAGMLDSWRQVYRGAGLEPGRDRIFFAFSFGPFLGFWTAFEAASSDYLSIPGGGLGSLARLSNMARLGATVLCCTPTYAIRLGEAIGSDSTVSIDALSVHTIIVAGEPGGSLPSVRRAISELWGARVYDHHGMSEVGPVSYEHPSKPENLSVIESAYLAEVVDPETGSPVSAGEIGELVLTTLDRCDCPMLRYRTGDLVKANRDPDDGLLVLEGGILGRADDMAIVRGVNIYPSAIEEVIRSADGANSVAEFRIVERKVDAMTELEVEIEPVKDLGEQAVQTLCAELAQDLAERFSLRIMVKPVACGALPRYEFKSVRWVRDPSSS